MTSHPPLPKSPASLIIEKHASSLIIALSLLLFLGLFIAMGQVDHPTLDIVHGFTDPLVDEIGDIGNELGDGLTLVFISLAIGGVGLWLNAERWKYAGLFSLLAHGISGLITQILKHSLSRPRPRLMDTTSWEIGPTLESGLDSFPSGHTSGSFSVAMIFAYYFPKGRLVWFGLASFVALCRVIKGSHFPTDVLGGLLVGIGTGLVLVYSRDTWKEATTQTLAKGLPWLIAAFGFFWILIPHPGIELEPDFSLVIGLIMIMAGLGLRLWWIRECSIKDSHSSLSVPIWPRLLMGLGLAITTGSLIVLGVSLLASIIWWIASQPRSSSHAKIAESPLFISHPIGNEAILGFCMMTMALLVFSFRLNTL